ncbi:MAG TPA: DUF3300 domain-containing protein [Candidatus Binatia bacterium]|nr:DUF3300 domain-containing protein [Candidatus Binatia bacterium]
MKKWNSLSKSGPAAAVLFAGVLVLATGCMGDRETYVRTVYPVQAPEPPPPPPEVIPLPSAVELPPAPPPAPVAPMRSAAELDTMLAPIALYPDPLLAQLLPAATLPEQVVLADRYLRAGGDLNQVDAQPWDNSLKALARYPATLSMLDDNLAWTTELGQAFLNQPADVMDSVQRLRAQARAVGNLVSTPQQTVEVNDGNIEIVPATPEVIYVPVYQPEVVYVRPPPAPGRFYISFGAGLAVGAWLNHDCDWHEHEVIVWHHDHPRPSDWWYHPEDRRETPRVVNNTTVVNNVTVVNNTTIVNQNVTVWHPRTRGAAASGSDRGWGQQNVRANTPVRNEEAKPRRSETRQPQVVAEAQRPAPSKEIRPAPPVREVRPSQPEVQREVAPRPEVRANPPRENVPVVPETQKPVPTKEVRPAPPAREIRPNQAQSQQPPVRRPEPQVTPPREEVKPAPVIPARSVPSVPARNEARPSSGQPALAREVKPAPRPSAPIAAPKDTRPVPAPVSPRQPPVATSTPRPAAPPASSRPVAIAAVRPPSGALAGIESSRVTREASARGQQSREAVARPAVAARPAPAPAPAPKANSPETKKSQKGRGN